ncbi:hypothetical protein [Cardinium endosymbiont of Nabis limbatus]|uniref:hypothetical protein n=1 Tax=Cardinium endosymbiont of Nabis limbatus TaxID=3066217 RepID=UPI003AF38224
MKRLHNLLFLLLSLSGCNKAHQMGMRSTEESFQDRIPPSNLPVILDKQTIFTASGGHLGSFSQKDGIWVATVDKKLPLGFSNKVKLPVHCAAGFSVEGLSGYSPEGQKNLIHIERTSSGQAIVYVGKIGLMGGGAVQSWEREGHSAYRVSCGVLGFVEEYHKCLQCGYRRVGDTNTVANSLISHYCNNCKKCLVKYKCPYSYTRICKECCGCSERIASEKERESVEKRKQGRNQSADAEKKKLGKGLLIPILLIPIALALRIKIEKLKRSVKRKKQENSDWHQKGAVCYHQQWV